MSAFDRFITTVQRALPTWPDGIADAALALAELATSSELRDRVVAELETLTTRPTHSASVSISLHGWVLWMAPGGVKLTVSRVAAGAGDDAGYLTDSPAHQLITPCTDEGRESGAIAAERYAPIGIGDSDVLSPGITLEPRGACSLRFGEVLTVQPREVIDILPHARARHLLIFDGPRRFTQQWVYDRHSLTPIASVAADPHDARLESGMRLLRVLDHTPGAAAVAGLATHDAHFVRWTAIRYVMGLDPEVGLPLLERATDDPHPHVRAAAQRALSRLNGNPSAGS